MKLKKILSNLLLCGITFLLIGILEVTRRIDPKTLSFYSAKYSFESLVQPYNVTASDKPLNTIQENLRWLILPETEMCVENSTFILAVVISATENFGRRMRIRNTWAKSEFFAQTGIRAVFLLGSPDNNKKSLQSAVEKEAKDFGDIIQNNFTDSYRNLTYKTISAVVWVSNHCHNAPWILKIDDDVYMNPFNLRIYLEKMFIKNPQPAVIMGRLQKKGKRHLKGKWKVTKDEYPFSVYPDFTLGSVYIVSRSAIDKLILYISITPFIWLEDVFMTGLVAERANVTRIDIANPYFATSMLVQFKKNYPIFVVTLTYTEGNTAELFWRRVMKDKPPLKVV